MRLSVAALAALALLLACGSAAPPTGGPVVLVVIDTLRADRLGAYGHERDTSPELDAWAEQGRLYERAWSTSSWTLPGVASILTGRIPAAHGAVAIAAPPSPNPQIGRLPEQVPTLAEGFRRAGYATAAFVTNPYLTPLLGLDRGFDLYDYARAVGRPARRAHAMVDRVLAWIDARDGEPFFLMLHLMDPHLSYDPMPPQRGRFTGALDSDLALPLRVRDVPALRSGQRPEEAGGGPLSAEDRRFVAAAYDEEIASLDAQLGRLRRGLEARGVFRTGIVALASDHGEELFDHGGFEHGHTLFEEVVRVPLLFWGAGVSPGRETAPVSLVDVAPTLLDAAGLPLPRGMQGLSLWPNLQRGARLPERTLRFEDVLYGPDRRGAVRWPWKVVVSERDGVAYWNLAADPGEHSAPRGAPPAPVARLLAELGAEGEPVAAPLPAQLDRETLEDLKALGYMKEE